jgi:hypothetical protein
LPAEGFGDLLVALIPPGRRVEDDLEAVRVAGFREELPGFGRVRRIALDGGVIAEHLRGERAVEAPAIAFEHRLDDGIDVGGVVEGLAHAHVRQRLLQSIEP